MNDFPDLRDGGSSARRSPFARLSFDRSPPQTCRGLNELRNGVADGFTLLRKPGRPDVDIVDASLDDLLQGGAAVVEPILDELRPQRIDVEQLKVANVSLEVADALAGYGIAHRQYARRLHQVGQPLVEPFAGFHQTHDDQWQRLPIDDIRSDDVRGGRKSGNSQYALLLDRELRPHERHLMDDRAADRDRDHGPARRKVSEFRGAARSLRDLHPQLLLQPFSLDERQPPVRHLLTETFRDLGFGEHEWPDGKGTIELIAIDVVLAELRVDRRRRRGWPDPGFH